MNDENFLTVRRISHAARDGLRPYVLREYKFIYTKKQYLQELQKAIDDRIRSIANMIPNG